MMKHIYILAGLVIGVSLTLGSVASAQFRPISVPAGGLGWAEIQAGSILFGNGGGPLATSSAFQFNTAAGRLTTTYASTTAVSLSGAGTSGAPSLSVGAGTVGLFNSSNNLGLAAGSASVQWSGAALFPGTDNAKNLGGSANRWLNYWGSGTATTSALAITGITGSTQCLQADTNGLVSGTGAGCGSGSGGAFPFTTTAYSGVTANATSTPVWFKATSPYSLIASSTYVGTTTTAVLNGMIVVDGVRYAKTSDGIQQALNECAGMAALGCSHVHITSGTTTLASSIGIPSNMTLSGEGWNTILAITASSTRINVDTRSKVTIKDLLIDQAPMPVGTPEFNFGIWINDSEDIVVDHVRVKDAFSFGIFTRCSGGATATRRVTIKHSRFNGRGTADVAGGGPADSTCVMEDVSVFDNHISQNASLGANYAGAFVMVRMRGAKVQNNTVEGNFNFGSEQFPNTINLISNNVLRKATGQTCAAIGISEGFGVTSNDSTLAFNGNVLENAFVDVLSNTANTMNTIAVNGNAINAAGCDWGVLVQAARGVSIVGNSIASSTTGIQLADSSNNIVDGNSIASTTTAIKSTGTSNNNIYGINNLYGNTANFDLVDTLGSFGIMTPKVGIGTAAPAVPLHLLRAGADEMLRIETTGSDQAWQSFWASGSVRGIFGFGSSGHIFSGATAESISLRATGALHLGGSGDTLTGTFVGGKFGLGTTSPGWLLQSSAATAPQLTISDSDAGTNLKHWTLSSLGGEFRLGTSSDAFATSTAHAIKIGTDNIVTFGNNSATCVALTGSAALCDGDDATGAGGGTYPFTPTANFAQVMSATSTALWARSGLFASSTSQIASTTFSINGNVGINNPTPARNLSVSGSGEDQMEINTTGSASGLYFTEAFAARSRLGVGDSGNIFSGALADSFSIRSENALHLGAGGDGLALTLIAGGNIGIGTTSPQWKQQIASTITPQLTISDTDAGTNLKHWTLGSLGGVFSISSSSDAFATSTFSSFFIDQNGKVNARDVGNAWTGLLSPTRDLGFSLASTTWGLGTTTRRIGPSPAAITVRAALCETSAGTLGVSLHDGTNRANYIPTASTTINKFAYTTNNTFTEGETIRVDIGTAASSPTELSCRLLYTYN